MNIHKQMINIQTSERLHFTPNLTLICVIKFRVAHEYLEYLSYITIKVCELTQIFLQSLT